MERQTDELLHTMLYNQLAMLAYMLVREDDDLVRSMLERAYNNTRDEIKKF